MDISAAMEKREGVRVGRQRERGEVVEGEPDGAAREAAEKGETEQGGGGAGKEKQARLERVSAVRVSHGGVPRIGRTEGGERVVSFEPRLNFAKFETVRGRWRLQQLLHPRVAFLPSLRLRRGSLSFSPRSLLSLPLFLAARRRPCLPTYLQRILAFAAVAVYYGNFEPIRKSIATPTRGKERAETACVAARRARRVFQARLFPCLRNCVG